MLTSGDTSITTIHTALIPTVGPTRGNRWSGEPLLPRPVASNNAGEPDLVGTHSGLNDSSIHHDPIYDARRLWPGTYETDI